MRERIAGFDEVVISSEAMLLVARVGEIQINWRTGERAGRAREGLEGLRTEGEVFPKEVQVLQVHA
jgi:hypothetical protein